MKHNTKAKKHSKKKSAVAKPKMVASSVAKMVKIVVNRCYGGFSISPEAALWLYKKGYKDHATSVKKYFGNTKKDDSFGINVAKEKWEKYLKKKEDSAFLAVFSPDGKYVLNTRDLPRDLPLLIKCVQKLGLKKASGYLADLSIVEIPADVNWEINEHDGMEHVSEVSRHWY